MSVPSPIPLRPFGFAAIFHLFLALALPAPASPGALDTTLNGAGKWTMGAGGGGCYANAVVRQTDGKLVTAGGPRFQLTRYNANGSLDTTFGTRGKVQTIIGANGDAGAMTLLTGNKFLVAGGTSSATGSALSLAKYNTDGSLDTTFGGGDGIAQFADGSAFNAQSIVVQPNGKILVLAAATSLVRFNADGTTDTTFGVNGKVTPTIAGYSSVSFGAMVLQGTKFMLAGSVYNGTSRLLAVTRLTADGALDASFAADGTAIAPGAAGSYSSGSSLALFSTTADDNRVVVAGSFATALNQSFRIAAWSFDSTTGAVDTAFGTGGRVVLGDPGSSAQEVAIGFNNFVASRIVLATNDGHNNVQAVRLLLTGALDTTFDGDGLAVGYSLGGYADDANAVLVQSDNKVVIAGQLDSFAAVFRFNANGTPDTGFEGKGAAVQDFGDFPSHLSAVLPQADGKTIVAGDYALIRLNADGSPDTSFGSRGDGKAFHHAFRIRAAGLLPDGRIVVAGIFNSSAIGLARYSASGVMDAIFGQNGIATATPTTNDVSSIAGLIIQPNGTIIVGSTAYTGSKDEFALVRFLAAGIWDANFGAAGVAAYNGAGEGFLPNLACGGIARQPDGKLLATGYNYNSAGGGYTVSFRTVRFNADGTLDNTFGAGGVASTPDSLPDSLAIVVQPDGKIVIGGGARNNGADALALLRYTSNGTLDPTFDGDGKVYTVAPGFGADLRDLALLPDGKIVAVGYTATNSARTIFDFMVARYRPDGTLDGSFGAGGFTTFNFGGGLDDEGFAGGIDRLGRVIAAGNAGDQLGLARLTGDPFATISISRAATDGRVTLQGLANPDSAWSVRRTASLTSGYTLVSPIAPDAAGAWLYNAGVVSAPAFYRLSVP